MSPAATVLFSLVALLFLSSCHAAEDVASATVATDHKTTKIVAHAKKIATDVPVHDIKDVTDVPIGMSTDSDQAEIPTTVIDEETTTTKFHGDDLIKNKTTTIHPVVRSSGLLLMGISVGTVMITLL